MSDSNITFDINNKMPLNFKNGKFKILAISDLHGIVNYDRRLTRDIGALLDGVKPDLLLVLGDIADHDAIESAKNLRGYINDLNAVMAQRNIPWAHTFGNHDCEKHRTFSQMDIYEACSHCISKRGPEDIHGVTNYVLPIFNDDNSDILFNVWLLDSQDSLSDLMREYGLGDPANKWDMQCAYPSCLHGWAEKYDRLNFDQVMWYYTKSADLEKHAGHKIPALMAMHIAIPEYRVIYKNPAECYYSGTMRETVGNSPVNSGLFNAMLSRGDVKAMVSGHDHINDCVGTLMGIKLTYDAGLSYDCYCHDDMRGGRVFEINAADPADIKTYMVRTADYVKE